ncbi:efflux RND transporter permease subunit [Rhodanobacter denitrificans]|uniref:Cation/multidrug efflux pump n=1 Tax=Rhodanobacter denitrificans TaxID=666685 RepID=M4NDL3_9GAMM|nr:efflux RND transporter permease subunit [Rhodanobacter denitrificans]AGG88819.1 cation/multidrug efflux pump [Rhodanobacter denitrificans]UJM87944.1 efflux RND transporter permease subunit [Rhodanobacter denitrificans]
MNLSAPFIARPVATVLLMATVALAGIVAFPLLPVAPLPQIDAPTIQVTATLAGASAQTMASSVATPLERQLGQIAGVSDMTSFSAMGATSVTVQFDLDRNIDAAAQDVQAAITAAGNNLPRAMTTPPTYKKLNPTDAPILVLAASSDALPLTAVSDAVDNFLARKISQIPGVAQVSLGGAQQPAIRVQADPGRLAAVGLTLEQVRTALVAATTDAAKGAIDTPTTSFAIAANDQIIHPQPFEDVVLAYKRGAPIRVRDIGRAVAAAADRNAAAYYNGRPAILLTVYKQPDANVIATVERIKSELPQLVSDIPRAITIDTVLDRTVTIRAAVRDVEFTLVLGVILAVLVVGLFLRNLWATLVPGITIVLSLLGAFAAMWLFGFSLDNLSLMALTLGIGFVIDDAIVVVENIQRHVENGLPPMQAALEGSREIAFTVFSISLSMLAVFVPLLLMGGIVGRLFQEFSLTMMASIMVSMLVSLTLAPMLCSRFMRRGDGRHGRWHERVEAAFDALLVGYRRTLDGVLRHPAITMGVFLATVASALALAIGIPKGFFPIQDTGLIQGLAEAAQGTSPEEMRRLERQLDAVLLRDPGVAGVASWTGTTGGSGYAQTANTARYLIVLKPLEQRELPATEIIRRLKPHVGAVAGVDLKLSPTQDITTGGRTARGSFQYTLRGADVDELDGWSQRMLAKMRTLPQLTDVASDLQSSAPQLAIHIDRTVAAHFGISPQTIDDTLNDAYGQRQITQYSTQVSTYPLILEVTPDLQGKLASLDRLYVQSPLTGTVVPLSVMTRVDSTKVGPLSVIHQGSFPAVTLSFNLPPGVALGEAVTAIQQAAAAIGMPDGVRGAFEGNAKAFQSSLSNMPWLVLGALVLVYIVLGILYESFIHPLTILSTLPSAGVGALAILWIMHMGLTVIGIVGIILLIGIVKKNGIMLVDFAVAAMRERGLSAVEAAREACLLRFRPILMTTAAAMLVALPLAFGHGVGSELRQPLGYAMLGGLVLSQLLTLYTTPVIFVYMERSRSWLAYRRQSALQAPS